MQIVVESPEDVDRHLLQVGAAADKTQAWIAWHSGDSLSLLRSLKFETLGFHPVADHCLNVIEQINQTFTYAVALVAAKTLLHLHPEAGGYILAPGAHMSQPLDIMSRVDGLVGAETFAATHPRSNNKLSKDLAKLSGRQERFRYAFFASPAFPGTRRLEKLEKFGVQVWSVDV
jgi:hypothetical protein